MGRPINKNYIGNVSNSGQQIEATAYFVGKGGTASAWICAQKATSTYNMVSVCGLYCNRVELTNGGVSLLPGQANITVTPFGSTGSGATAVANLGVSNYTVSVGGTGPTTAGYVPGQILDMSGGTHSLNHFANARVDTVTLGNISVTSGAGAVGYTVGDTFTWGYTGWYTPTVVTVASTKGNGIVNGITYTTPGTSANVLIQPCTPYSASKQANAWATGATFDVRWDVSSLGVYYAGDYTAMPANPVSFTAESGNGTGAQATATYSLSSLHLTAAGSNYQAAAVTISGNGNALASAAITCGAVTSLNICSPGSFGPTRPTVTVTPIASMEYAMIIRNLSVTTFDYNTYEWVPTGTTPVDGQAVLQTA